MTIKKGDLFINPEHKGCLYLLIETPNLEDLYPDEVAFVLLAASDNNKLKLCASSKISQPEEWTTRAGIERTFVKVGSLDLTALKPLVEEIWKRNKDRL